MLAVFQIYFDNENKLINKKSELWMDLMSVFHHWIINRIYNQVNNTGLPNWPLTTGLKNKSKATFEIEQC
jgi:hypothetical protein